MPYNRFSMHEALLTGRRQRNKNGVKTLDIAKRLLDYGFYAPTVYFPLIVPEAMMIEPTAHERRETLDAFVGGRGGTNHGRRKSGAPGCLRGGSGGHRRGKSHIPRESQSRSPHHARPPVGRGQSRPR